MINYRSGAEVLSEARLRRAALGQDAGVLIVEGRDDLRLVSQICSSPAHVLPAGAKEKVLDAASRLRADEEHEFVLLVDCDFDVAAGELTGLPHLVVTKHPDAESDMVGLGVLERIVLQSVPAAANSENELDAIAGVVHERAVALAAAVGQLRQLSRVEGLFLDFKDLRFSKARTADSADVDLSKLSQMLVQRSDSDIDPVELCARAGAITPSLMTCNGHDLIESVRVVLHEDFGIPRNSLTGLDQLLRACAGDPEFIQRWSVIERIEVWQERSGRRVLKA